MSDCYQVASNPNPQQKFEPSYLANVLNRELKGNHVYNVSPQEFLDTIFPEAVLPLSVEELYIALLIEKTGETDKDTNDSGNAASGQNIKKTGNATAASGQVTKRTDGATAASGQNIKGTGDAASGRKVKTSKGLVVPRAVKISKIGRAHV